MSNQITEDKRQWHTKQIRNELEFLEEDLASVFIDPDLHFAIIHINSDVIGGFVLDIITERLGKITSIFNAGYKKLNIHIKL